MIKTIPCFLALVVSFALNPHSVFAQEEKEKPKLSARDLYFSGSKESPNATTGTTLAPAAEKNPKPNPPMLGVRCSVTKLFPNGQFMEVSPDIAFRSGDRVRFIVEANSTGYLYIILRGSSGQWSLLFPNKEIDNGQNMITRGSRYEIPYGEAFFQFDQTPGVEKLFLVLTKQPEPDVEKLKQSLRQDNLAGSGGKTAAASGGAPAAAVIDDAAVNKIRSSVPNRDLVTEKVNEESAAGKSDKAIYVVNSSKNADSRIVVDISLAHK